MPEALPFESASFDNVLSTFGIMFAPDQASVAAELLRVCRPGGRIGMANWTPDGFIGQTVPDSSAGMSPHRRASAHPPTGATRPFSERISTPRQGGFVRPAKQFTFRYHSPHHWLDVFATYYGPVLKTLEALGEANAGRLRAEILALIDEFNVAEDGTMVVPSDYLEVVIDR